jgi:hypothetical protein
LARLDSRKKQNINKEEIFKASKNIMVVWGGLHPIREQLMYDICTIIVWIYTTTIVIRQSLSMMVMSKNSRDTVKTNNKAIDESNNRDAKGNHQSMTYSTWYAIFVVLISCVGTILITSRGTFTNRWTMTLPMIPLLLLYSCIYILSLYQQQRQSNRPNISIYVKILFGLLSFLCIVCILFAILLSILFPAVELPPLLKSTNNNNLYPSVGVIDFYIPIPSYNKDGNATTNVNDALNSCSVSPTTTDESSCIAEDIVNKNNNNEAIKKQKYLPVRILYPTNYEGAKEQSISNYIQSMFRWIVHYSTNNTYMNRIPYLNIETAIEFCRHSMRFGAPDPIKEMGWILHTWRLITLPLLRNVPLILSNNDTNTNNKNIVSLPLVVYSHGLGGTMDLYSYQTMSLAANGYIVLSMTHTDGTAPITVQPYPYQQHIVHDTTVIQLHNEQKFKQYDAKRQYQNQLRVFEYTHAVEYVHNLLSIIHINDETIHQSNNSTTVYNDSDDDDLHRPSHHQRMIRQAWKLNTSTKVYINGTYFMGHSFGGATALQAAYDRPDLVSAIVAHEPAIGWMSPNVCHSLFPHHIVKHIEYNDTICSDLDAHNNMPNNSNKSTIQHISKSLHDDFDMLILNSNEWLDKNWGRAQLLQKMYKQQKLGKNTHISNYSFIHQSHHNEFSDTSMLTPLWLARPVGLTGSRNPIHTAQEIAQQTLDFLHRVRHLHQLQ